MANEWYQNNINNMRGYQNINKTGTQAWPEYNENFGNSFAGAQRFDPRNLMRPSNLTRDMGASMYTAPPVYPGQRNIHEGFGTADVSSSFPPPEKTGIDFSKFTGPITGIVQGIKDQFQYRGAQGEAYDPRTGQMISAEDQNKMNALGGYYSEPARYDRRQRKRVTDMLHRKNVLGKKIGENNLKDLIALGYGPEKETITETVTDTATVPGHGGDNTPSFTQRAPDRGRARGRGQTGQIAGAHHFAQGGRIGYKFGRGPVLDENVDENMFEFMQDQGVTHSDMAEGDDAFDLKAFDIRIDELMKKHEMSYQDAYDIASQEFQHLFSEGQEDSFSDRGLASLV